MAKAFEVLEMLLPNGGWIIFGDEYENITWIDESVKISKQEFLIGFEKYQEFQSKKIQEAAAQRAALLAKLGITEEEAKLLLS